MKCSVCKGDSVVLILGGVVECSVCGWVIREGDKVTYHSFDEKECGVVKLIRDDEYVFVVYHCGDEWDQYQNYTAAKTRISDLTLGWEV